MQRFDAFFNKNKNKQKKHPDAIDKHLFIHFLFYLYMTVAF